MTRQLRYQVIDAFAAKPFSGNPAAVVWVDQPLTDTVYLQISAEFNLSETAFLHPVSEGVYGLRWFSPTSEVALCGHATLAAGHAILPVETSGEVAFESASGRLVAYRDDHQSVVLDFPVQSLHSTHDLDDVLDGVCPGRVDAFHAGEDLMVVYATSDMVREYVPNYALIQTLPGRGLMITAPANDPRIDCVSRFFAPKVGIPEDPVTGSAHCALAPYWQDVLGKPSIVGYQSSTRGGIVCAAHVGDRVKLSGRCHTVMEGRLWL